MYGVRTIKEILFKRHYLVLTLVLVLVAVLALSSASCTSGETTSASLTVAVTLLPQAGFVKAIGGDRIDVIIMVPPGASPHTYEVTPDQMARLSRAKMYAKVGSPVEFELAWMDKLIAVNSSMLVVDCSKGIQLMEMGEEPHENEAEDESGHTHAGADPHIWLSVENVKIMVQNICDGLVQVDSSNKSYFEKNCADYLESLTGLDAELASDLENVKNRSFLVFHPSFGYFARDYNLSQIAVEQNGKEPEADYLIRLIKEAREHDIRVVFASPQFSTKSAESVAGEIGGKVVIIDPLAEDFLENMRNIKSAMKQAMQ